MRRLILFISMIIAILPIFCVSVNDLEEIESPFATDYLMIYDVSESINSKTKKINLQDIRGFMASYEFIKNKWTTYRDTNYTVIGNVLRITEDDELEFALDLNVGVFETIPDWGLDPIINIPLSSNGSQGDENGIMLTLNSQCGIGAYGQNNGAGEAQCGGGYLNGISSVTTDASIKKIQTITLPDNSTYYIEATVIGNKSDYSDRCLYKFSGLFYNSGSGAVQQGSGILISKIESNVDTACDFVVSGNDVFLEVTGIVSETWAWDSYIDIMRIK